MTSQSFIHWWNKDIILIISSSIKKKHTQFFSYYKGWRRGGRKDRKEEEEEGEGAMLPKSCVGAACKDVLPGLYGGAPGLQGEGRLRLLVFLAGTNTARQQTPGAYPREARWPNHQGKCSDSSDPTEPISFLKSSPNQLSQRRKVPRMCHPRGRDSVGGDAGAAAGRI